MFCNEVHTVKTLLKSIILIEFIFLQMLTLHDYVRHAIICAF